MANIGDVIVLYRQVVNLQETLSELPDELMRVFHGETTRTYWALRENVLKVLCEDESLCDLVAIAPAKPEEVGADEIPGPALLAGLAILKGPLETIVLSRGTREEQQIIGFTAPPNESGADSQP